MVENNPEGADSSESASPTIYVCRYCKTDWETELDAAGYDCRDGFLSAAEVGAPHHRNRWWLLAHARSNGRGAPEESRKNCEDSPIVGNDGAAQSLAHPHSAQCTRLSIGEVEEVSKPRIENWWATEPAVGRVADGLPRRLDRIRGLGNAVVPQCARQAFMILMGLGGCVG